MRKADKNTEKRIIKQLTQVCHLAQADIAGFVWLTHLVNYQCFPDSLQIVCVFDTQQHLENALSEQKEQVLIKWITQFLSAADVNLVKPEKQIHFDSEQACQLHHQGNWQLRLSRYH
ncbi:Fis family transcriptional regulator [Catenovulum sediminis]|uniref:Fis family transcriptional regulator n=1 Tax=Catenovulum sediminis TaxID=1740262 RepID=UPI00117F32C0|nr:Fis family transcriptional regulator [Catenovulum sediminis]